MNKIKNLWLFIITISTIPYVLKGQATIAINGINNTDFLGSSNNNHVLFKANNTERMRIDYNNGNIGIGTTSPNNLIHAYKSGASADLYMQWSNGNTTYSSGLWVGINTNNVAELNMKDNKAFKLLTHDVIGDLF